MNPTQRKRQQQKRRQQELLDSLTQEQRNEIADLIEGTYPEGDYRWNGEDSVFEEDTESTLRLLANVFRTHDPCSAID